VTALGVVFPSAASAQGFSPAAGAGTMGAMVPVVLVVLALVVLAMLVVPRVRRRRSSRPANAWRSGVGGSIRAAHGRAAPAPAWSGDGELDDEWDDDLGWEDAPQSGRAPTPDAPPERTVVPAARRAAAGIDWSARVAAAAATGSATEVEPPAARAANGTGSHVEPPSARDANEVGRAADAGAAGRAAPDADGPLELEDDDWQAPPPLRAGFRPAGSHAAAAPAYAPPRGKPRKRLFSPLVLVGIYAVGGIGLVVVGVSLLSGSLRESDDDSGPSTPVPAAVVAEQEPAPAPSATPVATATPQPAPSEQELARREAAWAAAMKAAGAAAERAERAARAAERRRIARVRRARERAKKRERAERRRRAANPPATGTAPPATGTAPAAPAQPVTPPATPPSGGGGGGGGGGTCEFCIG